MIGCLVSLAMIALWALIGCCDWRTRRVPRPALALAVALALVGRPWPWWGLAILAMAWPLPRRATPLLTAPALLAGALTNQPAPGLALTACGLAWALGWWGGADSLCLLALALRHDMAGLLACGLALGALGLGVMLVRGRPVRGLVAAVQGALAGRPVGDIPAGGELPAAVALAAAGIAMEMMTIWGQVWQALSG